MSDKVLIVDDDNELRHELRSCLEGYDVIEAENGQEALNILSRPNEVSVIILDIKMPGLTGYEILRIIKKRYPTVSIVMLTGFSSKDSAIESLRGHADEYLEKPVAAEKLKETIDRLIEKEKYRADSPLSEIDLKIERIKSFVLKNCFRKISLADAADLVGLSPKYLSRIFREKAGMGFMGYKLKVKIDKSKEFLSGTGMTIGQISDKVGFMNSGSFMRIFKKITGSTPTEFRKKGKKKTQ